MIAPLIIPEKMLSLSDDELLELCSSNDQLTIERNSKRELIIMSPSGSKTGHRILRIASALFNWNDKTGLGYAFDSSSGFLLPDTSILSPDAAWIEKSKWDSLTQEQQEKFAPICPDFIIEVKSPSDSMKYLSEKMQLWTRNGCRLGWLIDPEKGEVTIFRPNGIRESKPFLKNLDGESVLPGFIFDLTSL